MSSAHMIIKPDCIFACKVGFVWQMKYKSRIIFVSVVCSVFVLTSTHRVYSNIKVKSTILKMRSLGCVKIDAIDSIYLYIAVKVSSPLQRR